ncbi:MAG: RNase adapter RapZ [Porticoccaceae bacterium]|nr:MAG: RNase adapter RapZ [Porticoccaceae bacterium]
MRLIVISGRSGSGKSTALNMLEDAGFTCIDNLPAGLLPGLFEQTSSNSDNLWLNKIAVGIDARGLTRDLNRLPEILETLKTCGVHPEVVYLDAISDVLIQRFSETRRKHPLSSRQIDIKEAIALETELLDPVASIANRRIDTSNMTIHQLRDVIKQQIVPDTEGDMAVLFESFAFKRGVPIDADFVFDVRCLPNPYWNHELRPFNGKDQPVIEFLESEPDVADMLSDISDFLFRWLPKFQANNRSYVTIAIGCTGGQHRSVYISNRLEKHFSQQYSNTQTRHRELN